VTDDSAFKKQVRARMAETGENYTVARRGLRIAAAERGQRSAAAARSPRGDTEVLLP